MKKVFMRAVSLLLAAGMALGSASTVSAAAPTNLVVLGDSIATGYRLEGYETDKPETSIGSFANLVAEEYGLTFGEDYFNFGIDGLQTAELLEKLDDEAVTSALENADSVVVSIGGNDFLSPLLEMLFDIAKVSETELSEIGIEIDTSSKEALLKSISGMSVDEADGEKIAAILMKNLDTEGLLSTFNGTVDVASETIAEILDRIYEITPEASVYFLTVLNPFSGVNGFESVGMIATLVLARLNKAIEDIALTAGSNGYSSGIADVYDAFGGNAEKYTNILEFDIHPNAEGHRLIADLLETAMDYYTDEQPTEAEPTEEVIAPVETPEEPTPETLEPEITEEEPETETTEAPETETVEDPSDKAVNPPTGISGGSMLIGVMAAATVAVLIKLKRRGK